jgi:hypothetical protein
VVVETGMESSWLSFEVGYAWSMGKRIVPLVSAHTCADDLPALLRDAGLRRRVLPKRTPVETARDLLESFQRTGSEG